MKTSLLALVLAALLGPAAAWAGQAAMQSNARLLLAATDGASAERERMLQRVERLRRIHRQPMSAPYGTGFEVRKGLSAENPDTPLERLERSDHFERPGRLDRPNVGGAGRGRR